MNILTLISPALTKWPMRRLKTTRQGTTLVELIVAGFLLITGMSLVTQGAVKSYRLQQESRHYQLAYDELANQLERLTQKLSPMSTEERASVLKSLHVSEPIESILALVKLSGSLTRDEPHEGDWLQLTIDWDRVGPSEPLSLVGWIRTSSPEEVSP